MRQNTWIVFVAAALLCACGAAVEEDSPAPELLYATVAIDGADEPGTPRQVRCQVGDAAEQQCTLVPLFGDESFQLHGVDVSLRMVVTGNEGGLFEVISTHHRVPLAGVYRRASASDPCWVADEGAAGPSPICIR